MSKLLKLGLITSILVFSFSAKAGGLEDVAKSIGLERNIYCYYAATAMVMNNGYGYGPEATKLAAAVQKTYLNFANTIPTSTS